MEADSPISQRIFLHVIALLIIVPSSNNFFFFFFFLRILATLRPFTKLCPKIRTIELRNGSKFCLSLQLLFGPFLSEYKIWYEKTFKFGLGRFLER